MQTVGEFSRKQAVDEAMPRDPAETREFRRNDANAVVRAAARSRACVAGVPVGLVDDVEEGRIQRFRQTRDNSFLHAHQLLSRLAFIDTK